MQISKSKVYLNETQIKEYLNEHLPYRLNILRAWDLYLCKRKAANYLEEEAKYKCYWESEFLDPSYEASIIIGRSLLNFLGIKRNGNRLTNFQYNEIQGSEKETVFIWHVIPGKLAYPIDFINENDQKHLFNLIKIANKSVAHLTTKTSTLEELDSLVPAKKIIYDIMINFVDGINKVSDLENKKIGIWWFEQFDNR